MDQQKNVHNALIGLILVLLLTSCAMIQMMLNETVAVRPIIMLDVEYRMDLIYRCISY